MEVCDRCNMEVPAFDEVPEVFDQFVDSEKFSAEGAVFFSGIAELLCEEHDRISFTLAVYFKTPLTPGESLPWGM